MFVRFALTAELAFNSDITAEATGAVEKTVEESNAVLFRKGVPKGVDEREVGRITSWSVEAQYIRIAIESGAYTRAHDALFRFRKQITAVLGKFRLGLRSISIKEYRITMTGEIPDGIHIPSLPFIRSFDLRKDGLTLDLAVSAADLENRVPDRILKLIEEKIQASGYGGKGEHWELIFASEQRPRTFTRDPTDEMVKRNWIRHGASRGQWIHGPQSVQLFRAFEQIVVEKIIRPLGFAEMIFPKLTPWEVWMRSGHAKGVYPEIYYVCTPKTRDPAFWEDVGDYFKVTGEVPIEMIREKIDGPIGGLCYAQCPSFWPFVQGETLGTASLPVKVFDRSGTSHRYESGGIHGIERVDEFHRIEIVWLGTAEQTVAMADKLHEAYHHVFEEILELEWRCARVTPWFMAQEGMIDAGKSPQTIDGGACGCGERVGTTDYEAYLPYSGNWLEFQNVSINGDKYPKGFNVKIQSGADCWSGCSGVGLERWTAAFLAQKGLEMDGWPDTVATLVGKQQEIFKFL
jgi:seryl-tRNA synthetase